MDYNGEHVLQNGFAPQRNPVKQVKGNVYWLEQRLRKSTGRAFPIRGVVVYPGWYVNNDRARGSSVWVLSPKAFPKWIAREPVNMTPDDVTLVANLIAEYSAA